MKRIAIIGAGSFLARNFIKYSIDNGMNYNFELYDFCDCKEFEQFRFQRIDFNRVEDVEKIDFSVDAIIIYIGKTGTTNGFDQYKDFIIVNEILFLNILNAYVKAKSTARIIYPSSRLMFKSKENGLINEDGERECKSIYAVTKQAAEDYLRIYKNTYGLQYVIIRICTPIGTLFKDFGNYGTFEIFKNQAIDNHQITVFGDGRQRKTFTSMMDICKAFSMIIDKTELSYNDYNLGGQALSLLDIAKCIADEYDVPIVHVPWPDVYQKVDGGSVVFDSSRFDKEFMMKYEPIK